MMFRLFTHRHNSTKAAHLLSGQLLDRSNTSIPCITMRRSFAAALFLAHVSGQALPPGFHHDIDSTTITAGSSHACVIERVDEIDLGGKVKCWGNDHFGQTEAPDVSLVKLWNCPQSRSFRDNTLFK